MIRRSKHFGIALAFVSMTTGTAALAQDRTATPAADPLVFGTGATYEVKFDDDPLAALPEGTIIPRITVRDHFQRAPLMRPRAQFVVEMLKSAETF
jgi:hypothetical protein